MTNSPKTPVPPTAPVVLVVDDQPDNLRLLGYILKQAGLPARLMSDSTLVLAAVEQAPPDLILLDVMMPEMDGYAVCRALKADERWKDIPVIFITALDGTADMVAAFAAGAVDYITKPVQPDEVEVRVRTHLRLRQQEQALARALAGQKQLEEWRKVMSQMIVHDLRSPLMVVSTYLTLLESARAGGQAEMFASHLQECRMNLATAISMAEDILIVGKFEAGEMPLFCERHNLAVLLGEELATHRQFAAVKFKQLTLQREAPADELPARIDARLVRRVMANLLGNAIKYSPSGGRIAVRVSREGARWRVMVGDEGPGIPVDKQHEIFQPYRSENQQGDRPGVGLGLAFCKLVINAHGGEIGVCGEVGQGSRFWFTLPVDEGA